MASLISQQLDNIEVRFPGLIRTSCKIWEGRKKRRINLENPGKTGTVGNVTKNYHELPQVCQQNYFTNIRLMKPCSKRKSPKQQQQGKR